MSVLFRMRVNKETLAKADEVTEQLGTKTPEVVRMFLHQIAMTGSVPLNLSVGDALVDRRRRNRVLEKLDDAEGW